MSKESWPPAGRSVQSCRPWSQPVHKEAENSFPHWEDKEAAAAVPPNRCPGCAGRRVAAAPPEPAQRSAFARRPEIAHGAMSAGTHKIDDASARAERPERIRNPAPPVRPGTADAPAAPPLPVPARGPGSFEGLPPAENPAPGLSESGRRFPPAPGRAGRFPLQRKRQAPPENLKSRRFPPRFCRFPARCGSAPRNRLKYPPDPVEAGS